MDYYNFLFAPDFKKELTDAFIKEHQKILFKKTNLTQNFFAGKKVLDIGVGVGWDILAMLRSGASQVVGLEYNKENCKKLKNRFRNIPKIEIINGDAMKLPFQDGKFDFVHASGCIHHAKSAKTCLKEMVRVIRKGGTVWFSVYGNKGLTFSIHRITYFLKLNILLQKIIHTLFKKRFGRIIIEKILSSTGSRALIENIMTENYHLHSKKEVIKWCKELKLRDIKRTFPNYGIERPANWIIKHLRNEWIQIKAKK